MGTYDGGLNLYDRETDSFQHWRMDGSGTLSGDMVISIYQDRLGAYWFGTYSGLTRWNERREPEATYRSGTGPRDLADNGVTSMLEDRSGTLWLGTNGGGLHRWERATDRFEVLRNDPDDANSLSGDLVNVIFEDGSGRLWIGTNSGLSRMVPNGFRNFTEKQGLPNNTILAILEDDNGTLWMSGNKGIFGFSPQKGVERIFDVNDGLQANEFTIGASMIGRDGALYFGGVHGFNVFYPGLYQVNAHVPKIVLTGFNLFNKPVEISSDGPLRRQITETDQLALSHDDAVISFEFAALDYAMPEKNRYAYRMEGFDKELELFDPDGLLPIPTWIPVVMCSASRAAIMMACGMRSGLHCPSKSFRHPG